jgi:hypothetical protein
VQLDAISVGCRSADDAADRRPGHIHDDGTASRSA